MNEQWIFVFCTEDVDSKNRNLNIQSTWCNLIVYLLDSCEDKMKKSQMYSKSVWFSWPLRMALFSWSCRSKAVHAVFAPALFRVHRGFLPQCPNLIRLVFKITLQTRSRCWSGPLSPRCCRQFFSNGQAASPRCSWYPWKSERNDKI